MKKTKTPEAEPAKAPVYEKQDLLQSRRYRHQRDLLNALLKNDKRYTIDQVDDLIDSFLKGKVK